MLTNNASTSMEVLCVMVLKCLLLEGLLFLNFEFLVNIFYKYFQA